VFRNANINNRETGVNRNLKKNEFLIFVEQIFLKIVY